MKLKLTLLAFCGLLVFAGCKKDKDDATPNNPQQDSKTKELIVGKNWKLTAAKALIPIISTDTTDIYNSTNPLVTQFVDCIKDDIITYNADGTYTLDPKTTVCSPALPTSGTWELSADQKTLTTDKGTDNERVLNLISVSSTTINATTTYSGITARGTFTAQ
ncbi:lipocalin family protein [Sporocytophaga myxococcoides]|uniref:lipocalin family protein n=1 Tax=Sporocytophaga myxococcoides TaxID=153721 RepID=UPI00041D47D7|nr:DUF5004 domain-containing protein [Sporocytophaga myxococcoides]